MVTSYVALGDSFTEGVGDDLSDGSVRGWADFVALGLAHQAGETGQTFEYANLAIRGRKLGPIIDEQLAPALALSPELLSINGGGNDIMRPRVTVTSVAGQLLDAVHESVDAGIHVLLLSGANPCAHLPFGSFIRRRGDELAEAVRSQVPESHVTMVDNWSDRTLEDSRYWSVDKLHLNTLGHARVASNVLRALNVAVPTEWRIDEVAAEPVSGRSRRSMGYYREYVVPWIGRRVTGRSSGDGRHAKRPTLQPVSAVRVDL
ncbi:MAG: SGNH/GDSL hydrolase family protein [Microbacteriaceae bacterium]